jgi:TonB family protein
LAYILKSDALLSNFGKLFQTPANPNDKLDLLNQSKSVLEMCLKNCRDNTNIKIQQERLEAVNAFYDFYNRRKGVDSNVPTVPAVSAPNITPLTILSKKPASYTDKARANQVTGTVRLLILFAASGHVTHIIVLKDLGFGLTENAVRAARQIKFEPAKQDGKPFSQVKIVEYSFTLY